VQIFQPGYRVGERIIRPARVAVAEPGQAEAPGGGPAEDTAPAEDAVLAEDAAPADEVAADQEEPGTPPGDTAG
jgi:molecular chaperone GrpE